MNLVRRRHLLAIIVAAVSIVALTPAAASQPSEGFLFVDPAWSHDGRRIAVAGRTGGSSSDHSALFVMNADGTDLRQIDTTGIDQPPGIHERIGSPAWSPGDDRIAFWAGPDAQGYTSLWRIGSDGGGLIRLVRNAWGPDWSPGGRRIAFYRADNETDPTSIYVINPDGTDLHLLAASPEGGSFFTPSWSPNGEKVVFATGASPDGGPGSPGLATVSNYGAPVRYLLRTGIPIDPAWSPSGTEIAYTDLAEQGSIVFEGRISLLNLKTLRVRPLRIGSRPSWSPNGKRIVFALGGSIYVMNRDGSHVRLLLQGG